MLGSASLFNFSLGMEVIACVAIVAMIGAALAFLVATFR